MAKLNLKGFIESIESANTYNNTIVQKFCLKRPGFVNDFGEKTSDDTIFEITAFNQKTELLKDIKKGDKVSLDVFLNSKYAMTERFSGYILNLSLGSIQKF